eukprot:scaffold86519_cov63-Phaeocystis_antarctica.AAC.4
MLDNTASSAEPAEGTPSRLSKYSRNAARKSNVESAATGSAYRALKLLVESMCGDPALLRCGLEKVWAEDGTVEWVAPESKERFVREGAASYGTGAGAWNRTWLRFVGEWSSDVAMIRKKRGRVCARKAAAAVGVGNRGAAAHSH